MCKKLIHTSSSFILMSFSVSTSGVESGRMGMGLSIRLSWASLLKTRRRTTRRRRRGGEEEEERWSRQIWLKSVTSAVVRVVTEHSLWCFFPHTWSSPVCTELCSSHSGRRRSRLSGRACVSESACSSISQSHNATGSPLSKETCKMYH